MTNAKEAAESHAVTRLKVIEWEAAMLLANHDGVHNMHGYRWGLKTALDNATNGIYKDDSFDAMQNIDYLIRSMRQCDALGRWPTRAERLPRRELKQWDEVGR